MPKGSKGSHADVTQGTSRTIVDHDCVEDRVRAADDPIALLTSATLLNAANLLDGASSEIPPSIMSDMTSGRFRRVGMTEWESVSDQSDGGVPIRLFVEIVSRKTIAVDLNLPWKKAWKHREELAASEIPEGYSVVRYSMETR